MSITSDSARTRAYTISLLPQEKAVRLKRCAGAIMDIGMGTATQAEIPMPSRYRATGVSPIGPASMPA
jgi:hypothetical protein